MLVWGAVALIAVGVAAYIALNPPVVTQTTTISTTIPTTSVVTTTVPTTSVITSTVPTTTVITTTTEILPPIPDFSLAKIDWRQFKGTSINFISHSAPQTEYMKSRLTEFEELTGIKVTFDLYAEKEYSDKVVIAAQSAAGMYDILAILPAYSATFVMQGWVDPIHKYIENPKLCDQQWYNISDFYDSALAYGKFDPSTNSFGIGKQYMIPAPGYLETLPVLYYRKDILSELGINVPQTFDELEQACGLIKERKKDIVPFVTRGCRMAGTWNIPLSMIGCYGGNFFDEEWYPILNRPEAIEAVTKYVMLMRNYGPPGAAMYDYTKAMELFKSGGAVFYLDTGNYYGVLTDPASSPIAKNVGIAEIPAGPKGRKTNFLQWSLAIDPNSKNKGAAWLFIQWVTSAKFAYELMAAGKGPSPRKSTYNERVIQDKWGAFINVVAASGKYSQILPLSLIAGKTQDIFSSYTSAAIDGQITPEEACRRANKEIYEAMKSAGYYDKPPKYGKYNNGGNIIPHSPDWTP